MNGKRRAPDTATPEPSKKRKRNDDTHFPDAESVETTQELGEKIISLLKRSQDKNGRLIATEFLELPDRKLYPDYYEHIVMPMSINIVEAKLNNGEYSTMTDLESDLKRMVQNAKDYNSSKSDIFEDAERIRKALSNFMPKHNPAYQDPEYRAVPTPIPDHIARIKIRDSSASGSEPPSIKLKLNAGGRRRSAAPSEPIEDGPVDGLADTQLELLDELSSQEDAINFERKPPRRELPHYYKVIKQPTSINDVRTMVQQGKITNWDDFAREARLIWSNAKEYNESGSEIYTMAERLETWLEEKLQSYGVPPKIVPRLSLNVAQQPRQLKLKVGTPTTPAMNGSSTYTVDQEALQRQRSALASAMRQSRGDSAADVTPAPNVQSSLRRSVSVVDLDVPMTGMNGHAESATPAEPTKPIVPPGPANIPTPTLEGVPPHQPLKPALYPATAPLTNGFHAPQPQMPVPAAGIFAESTNPIDRKFRDANKSSADALLQSVTYMTNPLMPTDPKWRLVRHASSSKTQTSYYTYLPSSHNSLRIVPELHADLKAGKRKYKLFVLNNGSTLPASPDVAGQGVYDLHLVPGENVVTVEAISALKEGEKKEYAKEWEQFDFERVTFYVFLRPQGS